MLARPVSAVSFEITTPYGVAYRGTSTDDVGSWNSAYRAVYQLSFSGLNVPGIYQVKVTSPAVAASPAFTVGTGAQLYRQLVDNGVQYFTSERDGPDVVPSVLGRQPANLTDERAYRLRGPGLRQQRQPARHAEEDRRAGRRRGRLVRRRRRVREVRLHGQLRRRAHADRGAGLPGLVPGPAAGGRRSACSGSPSCGTPCSRCCTRRSGSATATPATPSRATTTSGSCPRHEDRMNVSPGGNPGPTAYFVKYRPVFEAAPPGKPVSPDLAGRFAADFALGAQLSAPGARPGAGPVPARPGPGRLRDGQDHRRRAARHRVPARLLPGHPVEERHAVGRGRDRPGRRGDRRPGRAAERGPGHRGPLGPGVHRPGSPGRRGHVQPLRRRRGGRGRAAAGHAAGAGSIRSRPARSWTTWPPSCGPARTGPRATRSRSAPSWAPPTPRRTRSACSSPTPCTRSTAARARSSPSRSSS